MGLSSETRFYFGYTVRFGVLCLGVRESIAHAGMGDSFGTVQLPGKSGESGSTVRLAGKGWKPNGGKVFVFLLVRRECSWGRLTWSGVIPHGWI